MRRLSLITLFVFGASLGVGCGPNEKDDNPVVATDAGSDATADVAPDTGKQDVCIPAKEFCNGADDDCDGVVDESCPCDFNQTDKGVCSAGTIDDEGNCTAPPSHEMKESKCDGQDNDCDGAVDEDCGCVYKHVAKGVCAQATISGVQSSSSCGKPDAYEQDESKCDAKDNDCDGIVDEGCNCVHGKTEPCYTGPDNTQGVGACKAGKRTCEKGEWTMSCEMEVTPTAEMCDQKDNDCDGEVDEMDINEDFEGSNPGWKMFNDGRNDPRVDADNTEEAHSGSESGKAEDPLDGVCGKAGGIAKDFQLSATGSRQLSLWIKADTDTDAVIGVALKDSSGIHVLWHKVASGTISWQLPWTKKTFDISQYDKNYKLIVGSVDDGSYTSTPCDHYDHDYEVWVDDVKMGIDCSGSSSGN